MRSRDLLIVLLGGPIASTCLYWIIAKAGEGTSFEEVLIPSLLPLVATTVWGVTRTDRWRSRISLLLGVFATTAVVFVASFVVYLLVASWQCPPDAYECPI